MKNGILITLIAVFFCISKVWSETIGDKRETLPENDLYIGTESRSGIDETTFNSILDRIERLYRPVVRYYGATFFHVLRHWNNGDVSSYVSRSSDNWYIGFNGGLARHSSMTADGFVMEACFALGFHLGGSPSYSSGLNLIRGESAYFATAKCFRKYAAEDNNQAIVGGMTIPTIVSQRCEAIYTDAEEAAICKRGAMAGLDHANFIKVSSGFTASIDFTTPSQKIVLETKPFIGLPQCQLDTYFEGALCDSDNDVDSLGVDCKLSMGAREGTRPHCWYKSEGFLGSIDTRYSTPTFGDVNRDGRLDIVLGGEDGTLHYFERTQSGDLLQKSDSDNPFDQIDVGERSAPVLTDINGDNYLDLLVGEKEGALKFFAGDQSGDFAEKTGEDNPFHLIDVGSHSAPAFEDINGDGREDLIVGAMSGSLHYFERDQSGDFVQRTGEESPFDGIDVGDSSIPTFGDINGDEYRDLIVGESTGIIHYFENDRSGGYPEKIGVENPFTGIDVGENSAPVFGDIGMGSPLLVLLVGDRSGFLRSFRVQYEEGHFVKIDGNPFDSVDIGEHATPTFIDVNRDGFLDLVIGDKKGTISYFENDRYGNYIEKNGSDNPFSLIDVGVNSRPIFWDINGDGRKDLVIAERKKILYFEKNQSGDFMPKTGNENPFRGVTGTNLIHTLGDVDEDGSLDLLVGEKRGRLLYFERDQSGDFIPKVGSDNPFDGISRYDRTAPILIDRDGDGDLELVLGTRHDGLKYYDQDQSGDYRAKTGEENPFGSLDGGFFSVPAFSVVNKNGFVDLVVGTEEGTLRYFANDGNGAFMAKKGSPNPFRWISVDERSAPTLFDVNRDGHLDLVVGQKSGALSYFERNLNGYFIPKTGSDNPFDRMSFGRSVAPVFGYINSDDYVDLLIGGVDGALKYFVGDQSGDFIQKTGEHNPFDGVDVGRSSKPALGDLNKDGFIDLVVGESGSVIHYFENDGSGNFVEKIGEENPFDGFDGGRLGAPALGDLGFDGDLDLLVGEREGTFRFFENDGSGSFAHQTGEDNPFDGISVRERSTPTFADVNSDRRLDLVAGRSNGELDYYRYEVLIAGEIVVF